MGGALVFRLAMPGRGGASPPVVAVMFGPLPVAAKAAVAP